VSGLIGSFMNFILFQVFGPVGLASRLFQGNALPGQINPVFLKPLS
jgi:hypothetical protein